ncbi:MAG: ABC transporter ATP-binding protein [Planctomycetota bacterium]
MRTSNDTPAVHVTGLRRSFGALRAVDGLDLEVRRGEALGLLGPNGAGKTTTLRILSTLASRDGGEVRVLGLDPATDGAALRARIGVVPQEIALYSALTARENLEFFAAAHGVPRAKLGARVDWALGVAGLADRARSRVEGFSGGMKRRLNIVASMLHEPELLFLDEPTAGVDPQSRNHVFDFVEALRAEGLTLIYTTHLMGEVERLCDRIVVMDRGRAVAAGTLAELQELPTVKRALGAGLQLGAGVDLERAAETLRAAGIAAEVRDTRPGLEEVFLALTGRALRDEEA